MPAAAQGWMNFIFRGDSHLTFPVANSTQRTGTAAASYIPHARLGNDCRPLLLPYTKPSTRTDVKGPETSSEFVQTVFGVPGAISMQDGLGSREEDPGARDDRIRYRMLIVMLVGPQSLSRMARSTALRLVCP